MNDDLGAARGTVLTEIENASPEESDKAFQENDFENSRSGTRTRDPGIMSAVL